MEVPSPEVESVAPQYAFSGFTSERSQKPSGRGTVPCAPEFFKFLKAHPDEHLVSLEEQQFFVWKLCHSLVW